jgi:hypothetical protein
LAATILGVVQTVQRRQWGWLALLCGGFLAPLSGGIVVSYLLPLVGDLPPLGLLPLLGDLPLLLCLLLTPVAVFVYSLLYRGLTAPGKPSGFASGG